MDFNELFRLIGEDSVNKIAIEHDQARASYMLQSVTIKDWSEFEYCLGDYYRHHCLSVGGGDMGSASQNLSEAKELAARGAGRNTNIKKLFRDARTGSDGGMRQVLDHLANAIKQQYIERYITDTFDAYVVPCSIDDSTEIMRQFLNTYQNILPSHIDVNRPEFYASNYKELINIFSQSIASISSEFRRI